MSTVFVEMNSSSSPKVSSRTNNESPSKVYSKLEASCFIDVFKSLNEYQQHNAEYGSFIDTQLKGLITFQRACSYHCNIYKNRSSMDFTKYKNENMKNEYRSIREIKKLEYEKNKLNYRNELSHRMIRTMDKYFVVVKIER